jgi:hypothetical protein
MRKKYTSRIPKKKSTVSMMEVLQVECQLS